MNRKFLFVGLIWVAALLITTYGAVKLEQHYRTLGRMVSSGSFSDRTFFPNRHVGWTEPPHARYGMEWRYFWDGREHAINSPIPMNAQGFHDLEWDAGLSDGPLLFLGDSFTAALQLDRKLSFVGLVEQQMGRRAVRLAVNGWAPDNEYAAYQYYGKALRPQVVVQVLYLGNDVLESTYSSLKKRFYLMGMGYLAKPTYRRLGKTLKRVDISSLVWQLQKTETYHRALATWFRDFSTAARSPDFPAMKAAVQVEDFYALMQLWGGVDQHIQNLMDQVQGLHDEVVADGGTHVVMLIPSTDIFVSTQAPTVRYQHEQEIYERVKKEFESRGINYFDVRPLVQKAIGDGRRRRFNYYHDGHFNPEIHAVLAPELTKFLKRTWNEKKPV